MALDRMMPAPSTRAVLLDALGTLLELRDPAGGLRRELSARFGLQIEPAAAAAGIGAEISYYRAHHDDGADWERLRDLRLRCADVLRDALVAAGVARAAELERRALAEALVDALEFAAYPEVPEVLAGLRDRGLTLIVVSNWDVSLGEGLDRAGIGHLVHGSVSSAVAGAPKPDPTVFRAALELAGAEPLEALHVGDSPQADLEGARAAGIPAVLVDRHGLHPDVSPRIASLAELPARIA